MVPLVALFEFSAFKPVEASGANNATGGTGVVDVATRASLKGADNATGGTCVADAATRPIAEW